MAECGAEKVCLFKCRGCAGEALDERVEGVDRTEGGAGVGGVSCYGRRWADSELVFDIFGEFVFVSRLCVRLCVRSCQLDKTGKNINLAQRLTIPAFAF